MPIYKQGKRWRVRIWNHGRAVNRIVRGYYADAQRTETEMYKAEQINPPVKDPDADQPDPISSQKTFLYFVQVGDTGPIKIGRAENPERRLKSMQSGNHEELRLLFYVDATFVYETYVHGLFKHLRIRGEWFRPEVELLEFMKLEQNRQVRFRDGLSGSRTASEGHRRSRTD